MNLRAALGAVLALLALTGPAAHAADLKTMKMPSRSGQYTVSWRGMADKIYIRYTVVRHEGLYHVCGNYAMTGHSQGTSFRKGIRSMYITLDDKEILRNLIFFTRHASRDALVGGKAACRKTKTKATGGGHQIGIGSGKTIFND
ncbi:hypothetical protein RGUI_0407 [Rhodovulum sp. P5]|nr:hypothetical protein RGUI_0407 [Rhodovulum sp. P5]